MEYFAQIRTKCYAPKLEGAGKIGYSVYEISNGERYVRMDGNHVGMNSPGTFSPLYFKVCDPQFERLDRPFALKLNGYSEITRPPEFCSNATTPGFLRAVLIDYFKFEKDFEKALKDNPD